MKEPFSGAARVDLAAAASMVCAMSVAEIKAAIDRLKPQEEISRHLRRLPWGATPERQRELAEIMDEMEGGKKVSLDELRRRHVAREAKSA